MSMEEVVQGQFRWTDDESQPVGVAEMDAITTAVEADRLCALGYHAWVPWLRLENRSYMTWCARQGCDHKEQFDAS
jgi:hypothetical protein